MITVNDIKIPTEWSELTTRQYIFVIEVLKKSFFKDVDPAKIRYELLVALTGYKPSKKRFNYEDSEEIKSNLVIISDQIRFPFQYDYAEKSKLADLSHDAQTFLKKHLPSECHIPDLSIEINSHLPLTPSVKLDTRWIRNPLPDFVFAGHKYYGPQINIDKFGILETDITAGKWVDVLSYYNAFIETKYDLYLNKIASLLYATKKGESLPDNPPPYAVITSYMLVENLLEYIVNISAYSILYNRSKTDSDNKITLGVEGVIFDLAKSGYGSVEELRQRNLVSFLNMQIDKLKSFIEECRSYKLKDTEIHSKYNIPWEALKKL